MTEIEAVYARHSVRAYLDKKIDAETAEKLKETIEECGAASGLRLQFLPDAGNTFGRLLSRAMGLASAPAVIACVGKDGPGLEERIGYWGERAVLAAQSLGLNTCWAGTFSPKGVPCEIAPGERLVIVIAVGYGKTQGKPHRGKTAEQGSSGSADGPDWFRRGVELALLAPTAINQQKFEFVLEKDGSVTSSDRRGPFSGVDLGIVRYHFDLARKEAGLKPLWE